MKLNQFSQNEVEVLGDSVDTEFSIDTESLGVLFKGFSDALYSDKFGSIVREITSNCFDAHEEIGQKLDVQVRMVTPGFDEGKIIFEDFGPGLSPDRIKNIYSKYFASTKRNTNDQIGGFGIGAKSPLAYADSFNVVTRVDGVEYDYIIHKGEQVPIITLIGTKPTDSINGTQVIIPIANNADYSSFVNAVKDQLRYFDNISYKIPNEDISNEYKIFRGKHWIHTTNGTSNGDLQICIGKVGYPLDFKAAVSILFLHIPQIPSTSKETLAFFFFFTSCDCPEKPIIRKLNMNIIFFILLLFLMLYLKLLYPLLYFKS